MCIEQVQVEVNALLLLFLDTSAQPLLELLIQVIQYFSSGERFFLSQLLSELLSKICSTKLLKVVFMFLKFIQSS